MSCPICNNTELYDGTAVCPKCGSDIEVFSHIEDARREYFTQKKSILVLAAVLGVVVVSWGSVSLFSGNKTTEVVEISPEETVKAIAPVPDSAALAAVTEKQLLLEKENEELKSELASMKSSKASTPAAKAPVSISKGKKKAKTAQAAASTEKSEGGFITHTVKRGDNPWTISKKYFHNGSHAKQIVADNNLQNMKNIPIGTKLKIQK